MRASDGFTANPREAFTNVTINVKDLLNDDSQGDGIADEWAVVWFGISAINPTQDFDGDGSIELFEYWANSNPTDAQERGLIIEPSGVDSTPGEEGYFFEWVIRTSLTIGKDYLVQGSDELNFEDLATGSEMEVISTTPLDGILSRVRIKIPTTSSKYFLRLRSP